MPANSRAIDEKEMSLSPSLQPAADEDDKSFRLLDLPPELVVRVLEFAVSINHEQKLAYTPPNKYDPFGCYATSFELYKQPAITRTCHWLRNEGLPIFYSRNDFLVTAADRDIVRLWKWMASLQAKHRKELSCYAMLTHDDGESITYRFHDIWTPSEFQRDVAKHSEEQEYLGGPEGYVRMEDGLVKVTVRTCDGIKPRRYYQLSFADRSHEQAEWWNVRDFEEVWDEEEWEECFNVDWLEPASDGESDQGECFDTDWSKFYPQEEVDQGE